MTADRSAARPSSTPRSIASVGSMNGKKAASAVVGSGRASPSASRPSGRQACSASTARRAGTRTRASRPRSSAVSRSAARSSSASRAGVQQQVEADGEDALAPVDQVAAQLLEGGVGALVARVGQRPRLGRSRPAGVQPLQRAAELARHRVRVERRDVQADVERDVGGEQARQPAGLDRGGQLLEEQPAHVGALQLAVARRRAQHGRRDAIDDGAAGALRQPGSGGRGDGRRRDAAGWPIERVQLGLQRRRADRTRVPAAGSRARPARPSRGGGRPGRAAPGALRPRRSARPGSPRPPPSRPGRAPPARPAARLSARARAARAAGRAAASSAGMTR